MLENNIIILFKKIKEMSSRSLKLIKLAREQRGNLQEEKLIKSKEISGSTDLLNSSKYIKNLLSTLLNEM